MEYCFWRQAYICWRRFLSEDYGQKHYHWTLRHTVCLYLISQRYCEQSTTSMPVRAVNPNCAALVLMHISQIWDGNYRLLLALVLISLIHTYIYLRKKLEGVNWYLWMRGGLYTCHYCCLALWRVWKPGTNPFGMGTLVDLDCNFQVVIYLTSCRCPMYIVNLQYSATELLHWNIGFIRITQWSPLLLLFCWDSHWKLTKITQTCAKPTYISHQVYMYVCSYKQCI
jgi:hypothetical protein